MCVKSFEANATTNDTRIAERVFQYGVHSYTSQLYLQSYASSPLHSSLFLSVCLSLWNIGTHFTYHSLRALFLKEFSPLNVCKVFVGIYSTGQPVLYKIVCAMYEPKSLRFFSFSAGSLFIRFRRRLQPTHKTHIFFLSSSLFNRKFKIQIQWHLKRRL